MFSDFSLCFIFHYEWAFDSSSPSDSLIPTFSFWVIIILKSIICSFSLAVFHKMEDGSL